MDLNKLPKVDRPSVSPALLASVGFPAMDNPAANGIDFAALMKFLMVAVGFNHIVQVNDCETAADYTESDTGTFDIAASAATGKRVGTNCMKLVATAACDNSQYVDTLLINESVKIPKNNAASPAQMDWSDTRYLGFWVHNAAAAGDFGTAGELQVAITYNDGTISDKVNVQAIVDAVHQWFEIDMVSEGWERTRVESLRFYCNNANVGEAIYIDDILRYEISHERGPLYGCAFPIMSGTTIVDGDSVKWTVDGLIKSVSSADVADLGGVKLLEAGAPDAQKAGLGGRGQWGIIPSAYIVILRAGTAGATAGDILEWESNGKYIDVTGAAVEKGTYIALETAGASQDDIFALKIPAGAVD